MFLIFKKTSKPENNNRGIEPWPPLAVLINTQLSGLNMETFIFSQSVNWGSHMSQVPACWFLLVLLCLACGHLPSCYVLMAFSDHGVGKRELWSPLHRNQPYSGPGLTLMTSLNLPLGPFILPHWELRLP